MASRLQPQKLWNKYLLKFIIANQPKRDHHALAVSFVVYEVNGSCKQGL
jgi:hypothetical protein